MKILFKTLFIFILMFSLNYCDYTNETGSNETELENDQNLEYSLTEEANKLLKEAKEYNLTDEEFKSKGLVDKGDYFLYGGDIKLYKEDEVHQKFIDNILGLETEHKVGAKGLTYLVPSKWPNGVITYSFEGLSSSERGAVKDAMKVLENTCGVKYIYMHAGGAYRIWKSDDDSKGGASTIGLTPFANYEFISKDKWKVVHELCHGLGMLHEHQRPDRDKYIKVNLDNIKSDEESQFTKRTGVQTQGSYDYESIMHYGTFAFNNNENYLTNYSSLNPRRTNNFWGKYGWVDITDSEVLKRTSIRTKNPDKQWLIGQREKLSPGDKKTLKRLYPGEACGYWYDVKVQYDDLTRPIYRQDYYKEYYWKNPGHFKTVKWYSYKEYYWKGPWYKRRLKSRWKTVYRQEWVPASGWTYRWKPYPLKTLIGYHKYSVTEKRLKACF